MKRIIIGLVISAGLVTSGLVYATNNPKLEKNNTEVSYMKAEDQKPVEQSTTVETSEKIVADQKAVEPKTETPAVAAQEDAPEPFDAQLYTIGVLEMKAKQGVAVNAECFTKLFGEAYSWNMTQNQVDQAIDKVLTRYSSSCAAYAQFKSTGSF